MQLMVADRDKPSGIQELPPFERGGDALIGDARKNDERHQAGDDEGNVAYAS